MDELTSTHVGIGEIKTGRGSKILKTTLGSCVGIAFFWRAKNYYGLAHCLLPESPTTSTQIGAKYVNQAIPSLLAMMKIRQDNYSEIEAVVAGGGNMMMAMQDAKSHIGLWNSDQAVKLLRGLGIRIIHQDVGGNQATQMTINCATGEFSVSRIPKQTTGGFDGIT